METWGVAFLGIIALASLVQAAFLVGVAREGRRLSRRLDDIQDRLDREVRPALEQFARVSRNLAEVSDLAVLQARRVDDLVADAVDRIEDVSATLHKFILRPLGPLADVVAFLKGIKRGLEVYRQLGGFERGTRGVGRRYTEAEDEHLFI